MTMRVLSFPELRELKGIIWSRPHVHRLMDAGKFPRPIKLGKNTAAWLEDDIDKWISERMAERDSAEPNQTA
jgi:prophage regulatory protein